MNNRPKLKSYQLFIRIARRLGLYHGPRDIHPDEWWNVHVLFCQHFGIQRVAESLQKMGEDPTALRRWMLQNSSLLKLRPNESAAIGATKSVSIPTTGMVFKNNHQAIAFFSGGQTDGQFRSGWSIKIGNRLVSGSSVAPGSSNIAAFFALAQAATKCVSLGIRSVLFLSDNQAICRIVRGEWECRGSGMSKAYVEAMKALSKLVWSIRHIPHYQNQHPKRLIAMALDPGEQQIEIEGDELD